MIKAWYQENVTEDRSVVQSKNPLYRKMEEID